MAGRFHSVRRYESQRETPEKEAQEGTASSWWLSMAHPFLISFHNFGVGVTGAVAGVCASRAEVLASPSARYLLSSHCSPSIGHPFFGKPAATLRPADFHPAVRFGWNWPIVRYYGGSDKQTDRQLCLVRLVSFGNQAKNNTMMNRA